MTPAATAATILAVIATAVAVRCWSRLQVTRRALAANRRIVEKAVDSIVVADSIDGRILDANEAAAALLARSGRELTSLKIPDLLPERLVSRSAELVAEAWESGGITTTDLCFVSARGDEIPVEISGTVVSYERGSAVVIFARDIRTRKQLEARLVQSQKVAALGELVAGVAHEMNTPLGSLRSCIDTSRRAMNVLEDAVETEDAALPREATRALTALDSAFTTGGLAADRIDHIVRSLRNFARLDEAERKVVDLHDGIDSALTLMGNTLGEHIAVVKRYGETPPVDCRPNQLNQVFMHILKNAVEALTDGGTITISSREDDGGVRLEFADTGVGMHETDLARIFDPGFTTRGVGVGTGLGLSISHQIIQQHGGWIEASSTYGRGTTISMWIPRTTPG